MPCNTLVDLLSIEEIGTVRFCPWPMNSSDVRNLCYPIGNIDCHGISRSAIGLRSSPHPAPFAEQEIYGQWIMEELARHGYRLIPGTLYPMLQAMEARGYLTSREDSEGRLGRRRKVYKATKRGKSALVVARKRLRELIGEVGRRDP